MAAEVENKTLIQNETIILKRECRSKEIFKQLRYLNCLKKEILNSNFYTYYTRRLVYMFSLFDINHHLQKLTLKRIKQMCTSNKTDIDDQNLKVILKIIKDNPHAVIDEDYHPLLLVEISKETNLEVSNRFKPILENYIMREIK